MPFTDAELAGAMSAALIESRVMTPVQLVLLADVHTEVEVRETLTALQLSSFPRYWLLVNRWLVAHGGSIRAIRPTNVPGRIPGTDPVATHLKIVYDDAFWQAEQRIATDAFSEVKAVANALRFIDIMEGDDDEDDNDD